MLIYYPVMFCCYGIDRRRYKAIMFVTWSSCDEAIITCKVSRLVYPSVEFGCCKTYRNHDKAINFSGGLVVEMTYQLRDRVSTYWFTIFTNLVVMGLINVKIKSLTFATWPSCGDVILTSKERSVHAALPSCQVSLY